MRIFMLAWLLLAAPAIFSAEFEMINPAAEKLYAEGSYAQAHELFAAMNLANLTASQRRWVEFRRADTLWRAEISGDATANEESSVAETAKKQLEELIRG